jgi:NADPH:quinone reductase-like Zn-dependent oxidoreductase
MQAIVYDEFGPAEVLHPQDLDRPIPKNQDVLVRVRATSVNYGDLLARDFRSVTAASFNMPGLFLLPARMHFGFAKPRVRVLGSEYSGMVEAVGPSVEKFKPGDEVFGYLGQDMGAYAEFIRVSEQSTIALKPALMTFEEAAVTPYGASMAIALLDRVAPSRDSRLPVRPRRGVRAPCRARAHARCATGSATASGRGSDRSDRAPARSGRRRHPRDGPGPPAASRPWRSPHPRPHAPRSR